MQASAMQASANTPAPAAATPGYGYRDTAPRSTSYSGSDTWRNFWNPSASALNSGPLPSPSAFREDSRRRYTQTAEDRSERRLAGDRFRYTR